MNRFSNDGCPLKIFATFFCFPVCACVSADVGFLCEVAYYVRCHGTVCQAFVRGYPSQVRLMRHARRFMSERHQFQG